jgi:DNA-binding transcriptional LysR family regulator
MRKSGLVELDAVVAVAHRRSFRAAAIDLSMSPTALSNAVAGFEARIGARLFHRTTRSVSLTEEGERFIQRVAPAVAEIRGAIDALDTNGARPIGTLRINCSLGAAHRFLSPTVLDLLRRHPELRVQLIVEQRNVDIVAEGFDAGIRLVEAIPRDMIAVKLGIAVRFVVVGVPALLRRRKPRQPADLAGYPCIAMREPSGAPSRWEFARGRKRTSVEVTGQLTLNAPTLIRKAALEGAGLAYLADWQVTEDIAEGRLVQVLDDWMPKPSELALYYPGHRHVPAPLRALIDTIRAR